MDQYRSQITEVISTLGGQNQPSHLTEKATAEQTEKTKKEKQKEYNAMYNKKLKDNGSKKITVRLTEKQFKKIRAHATTKGSATLIKKATFAYLDKVFIYDESLWNDLISSMSKIGNNINQVARRVNQSAYHGVESPLNNEVKELSERYKALEKAVIERFTKPFDLETYLAKVVEANPQMMEAIKAIVQKLEKSKKEVGTS